jgi:hypothetical protein
LAGLAAPAAAVEVPPPAPLSEDLGPLDARTLVARWTRRAPPTTDRELLLTVGAAAAGPATAPVNAHEGHPALVSPVPAGSGLPPLALHRPSEPPPAAGFAVVLGGGDAAQPPLPRVTGGGIGITTRFDVDVSRRNPISLGGSAVQELTSRVVRTPEPGSLALFALGAAALAALVARRQRRRSS